MRAVGGCFALACFGVAILAGLSAGRSAADILMTAIQAMLLGQVLGLVGAWMLGHVFNESLKVYKRGPSAAPVEEVASSGGHRK